MTFSKRCILRHICSNADGAKCSAMCGSFIGLHGFSGNSGRSGAAGLPDEYRLVTLKDSVARADQKAAYTLVDAYAATFGRQHDPEAPRVKSLYLYSPSPGTGKTTTAAALLNEWLSVHYVGALRRGKQPLDRPAYFHDVNAWQSDYNEFNRAKVPESIAEPAAIRYYNAQKAAMAAPFAVLDDIGVRDCTEAFRADLHRIINDRVANGLPTVYTSNVSLPQINEVLRETTGRLADRMRDMTAEVVFVGESKRGMR